MNGMTRPNQVPAGARYGRLGSRSGLSLVELLVAMVVAGIVVGGIYQVLSTNQRVHTVQQERVQAQGTVRASVEVLSNELRGISIAEGDLITMEESSLQVRVPQAAAVVCDWEPGDQRNLTIRPLGRHLREDERVTVFAQNDPGTQSDDEWLVSGGSRIGYATSESLPVGCESLLGTSGEGQYVEIDGMGTLVEANDIQLGAPLRTFGTFEYGLFQSDGESYLGRRDVDGDGDWHRLVGPVRPEDGVRFEYLQADGTEANSEDEVARIRVTIHAESGATGPGGEPVADSLTMTIQPRD